MVQHPVNQSTFFSIFFNTNRRLFPFIPLRPRPSRAASRLLRDAGRPEPPVFLVTIWLNFNYRFVSILL